MKSRSRGRVTLNISGEIFQTTVNTLRRFPDTLLSRLDKQSPYYRLCWDDYFFNRSRQSFGAILFLYQSNGILSCPADVPITVFEEECKFYEIPDYFIEKMRTKEGLLPPLQIEEDDGQSTFLSRCWDILENPEKSPAARTFAKISLGFIMIAIISTCIETIPSLRVDAKKKMIENPWSIIDLVVSSWFLFELTARFISSPSKCKFVSSFLNWVDGIAVLPYFIMFISSGGERVESLGFLRIVRLIRVLRLFRLSKNSTRIKIITEVAKQCIGDLQMLFLCFLLLVITGGSLMYFIEEPDPRSQLDNIPDSFWWAIVTVTTCGYGDIIPVTLLGKVFTGGFMILGAITMCLPILSIVTKFIFIYVKNIEGDRLLI